jgi:hypothetical protein
MAFLLTRGGIMRRLPRVGLVLLALSGSAAALVAQGQPSADEYVAKNIQAKGGAEKLRAVRSTRITGKLTIQGSEIGMTILTKRPNLLRQELNIQGQTIVQAFDGSVAWTINSMMGSDQPQELNGNQSQALKEQADSEPVLLDYKNKGHKVELTGTEQIEGKNAIHLTVTKKSGLVEHFYLDPDTGLEMRVSTTVPMPDGQQGALMSDLSDYRDVDGMKVPFALKQSMNGAAVAQMAVEKVEFNVPADDALFKMPPRK